MPTSHLASSPTNRRRVVVTGIGIASAIGTDVETVWNNLIEGNTGIDYIKSFDTTEFNVIIGAEIEKEIIAEKLSLRNEIW